MMLNDTFSLPSKLIPFVSSPLPIYRDAPPLLYEFDPFDVLFLSASSSWIRTMRLRVDLSLVLGFFWKEWGNLGG